MPSSVPIHVGLGFLEQFGGRTPEPGMPTFRVYLRWAGQRTTDKTTTESRAVADYAFELLKESPENAGALAVVMSQDNRQLHYHDLPAPFVTGAPADGDAARGAGPGVARPGQNR